MLHGICKAIREIFHLITEIWNFSKILPYFHSPEIFSKSSADFTHLSSRLPIFLHASGYKKKTVFCSKKSRSSKKTTFGNARKKKKTSSRLHQEGWWSCFFVGKKQRNTNLHIPPWYPYRFFDKNLLKEQIFGSDLLKSFLSFFGVANCSGSFFGGVIRVRSLCKVWRLCRRRCVWLRCHCVKFYNAVKNERNVQRCKTCFFSVKEDYIWMSLFPTVSSCHQTKQEMMRKWSLWEDNPKTT